MGLKQQMFPEHDPVKFFESLNQPGEIKLSQSAANLVCRLAEEHSVWVLGVDVGILDGDGNYTEDFNEGWATKTGKMQANVREQFKNGIVDRATLQRNNLSASQAIQEVPNKFNAFILTAKLVSIGDAMRKV